MPRITEELIKAANSAADSDTSINAAKRTFDSEDEAFRFLGIAAKKIRHIDVWNKCGTASEYAVFDENGGQSDGNIKERRFIRIDLKAAGKFDWVRVISIKSDDDECVITVKPAYDPTQNPLDRSVISHFFSDEATNNFCLMRESKSVSFYIIGIEEKQNTGKAGSIIEAARNAAAANFGYFFGIQKAEWKMFCSKFLEIAGQR